MIGDGRQPFLSVREVVAEQHYHALALLRCPSTLMQPGQAVRAVVTAQAKTNNATPTVFFRTLYPAGYDDNRNSAGTYDIPLVFTLSAP